MKINYSIYYPGGNITALINRLILDPALKRQINDKIMSKNPQVEQVGFIDPKNYRLEMAGGEFCGNATRCAAYYYLNGQSGRIKIQVSGVSKKLSAGIDKNGNVWANMPVKSLTKMNGFSVVELEGITQVITPSFPSLIKAKNILEKLGLLSSIPAAGVMFIRKIKGEIKLDPFVYVRDIKTFFNETACASGTAAVGLYLAAKNNRLANIPVVQPSNQIITASVKLPNQVSISGPIKQL